MNTPINRQHPNHIPPTNINTDPNQPGAVSRGNTDASGLHVETPRSPLGLHRIDRNVLEAGTTTPSATGSARANPLGEPMPPTRVQDVATVTQNARVFSQNMDRLMDLNTRARDTMGVSPGLINSALQSLQEMLQTGNCNTGAALVLAAMQLALTSADSGVQEMITMQESLSAMKNLMNDREVAKQREAAEAAAAADNKAPYADFMTSDAGIAVIVVVAVLALVCLAVAGPALAGIAAIAAAAGATAGATGATVAFGVGIGLAVGMTGAGLAAGGLKATANYKNTMAQLDSADAQNLAKGIDNHIERFEDTAERVAEFLQQGADAKQELVKIMADVVSSYNKSLVDAIGKLGK